MLVLRYPSHGDAYVERILALISPIALWLQNESDGVFVRNLQGAGVNREGAYYNVALNAATAQNGGAAPQWLPASSSVANVLSTSLAAAVNVNEISIGLSFKVRAPSVWTDAATRTLAIFQSNANNIIRIRKTNANNTLDIQWFANATLASVATTSVGGQTGWIHVVLTASKSNNRLRMYLNGVQISTDQAMTGTWNGGAITTALIGANTAGGANPWDGYISDVVVGDREWSAAEVASLALTVGGRTSYSNGQRAANAAAALTTPTYDGSGQATHPDVIDFGSGNAWNGARYWMIMTPYPAADNTKENPSILSSADGTTWSVPAGLTNPIEAAPTPPAYNSDPDLWYDGAGTMYAFWRLASGTTDTYYYRTSTDGVTWGSKTQVLQAGINSLASTSFVKNGATWHAWSCDTTASPITLVHRTASALTGPWSAGTVWTVAGLPTGKELWHADVQWDTATSQYHALLCVRDTIVNTGGSGQRSLYFATSPNGDTWTVQYLVLDPLSRAGGWDGYYIYRSSLVRTASGYDIWYGATSVANAWRIGRTAMSVP